MNPLNEFHLATIKHAANHMLYECRHFNICDFDKIAKMLGSDVGGNDYRALSLMHCIDWADMAPELREQVRNTVIRLLSNIPERHELDVPRFLQYSASEKVRALPGKRGGAA